MKSAKKVLVLLLLVLLLFCLSGCRLTAEKLEDKMADAFTKKPPTRITLQANVDLPADQADTPDATSLSLILDIISSKEHSFPYLEMNAHLGENMLESLRFYPVADSEEMQAYLFTKSTDTWLKIDASQLDEYAPPSSTFEELPPISELGDPIFDPLSATLGDATLHTLTYQFFREQLLPYLALTADTVPGISFESLDLSKLSVTTIIYADSKSYLPRYVDMTIAGLDSLASELISMVPGAGITDNTVAIGDCHITLSMEYTKQELPTLPEEAPIKAAQAVFNPDMGDGTYVLQEMGHAVRVTCPGGWDVNELSYRNAVLRRSDGRRVTSFIVYTNTSRDLLYNYISQDVVSNLANQGVSSTQGSDGVSGDYETFWIHQTDGILRSFGWKEIGEKTFLLIETVDATGSLDSLKLLSSATELVADYQL